MTKPLPTLAQLGWRPFFQQQISLEELEDLIPGRVVEQHRSGPVVLSEQGAQRLHQTPSDDPICVGDWVLFDPTLRLVRCLNRQSLFQRKSPGTKLNTQLIAANIDTLFVVSSLNQDFNLNRIERFLALAKEAQVEPVVILTKADLCEEVESKIQQVQALASLLMVHAVNALDEEQVLPLGDYCGKGQTLALLGSSGVGKSTLVNSLMGEQVQHTASIREDDSKGRHTTTFRALRLMPHGGVFMDTPGMRELQLTDCEHGVNETFSEILRLADSCRFADCSHINEPGCAVRMAIEQGDLSQRRLDNFLKLKREQAFNSATLAEKRAKDKAFGKMVNQVQAESRHFKNRR